MVVLAHKHIEVTDAQRANLGVPQPDSIRLMAFQGQKNPKYKVLTNTREAIAQLLRDFRDGKARQYFKSDPIPLANEQPVKVVVGATFADFVLKSDKHVLLEAYAPWCGACKQLEPTYQALARRLLGVDDLIVAKIDAASNEHPRLETKGFPTIKFYKRGRKDKPIEFSGERDLQGFVAFLDKHTGRSNLELAAAGTTEL